MRRRIAWIAALVAAGGSGLLVLSRSPGQERPAVPATAAPPTPATTASAKPGGHDVARFSLPQKQLYFGAQRGADWLQRCAQPNGRFAYVSTPALRLRTEYDFYLREAGATLALARAGRFFHDDRAAACATRALLTLLLATAPDDPKNPQVRQTTLSPAAVNRLAAAGLLVQAVHELPAPAADLLAQGDQLCNYLRGRQRADGSLGAEDGPGAGEGADACAAEALCGLARGLRLRPAPWKADVLRKALAYYHPRWRERKALAPVPALTAAWADAYLATGERPFADAVVDMTEWLCGLQYQLADAADAPTWIGGFRGWADGKAVRQAPEIDSARCAEALADGCRVARQAGNARHYQRCREALERSLQFLSTLQYTGGNTQHFAEWYQREVVGAFHASPQDGNLRLDYTQHAVCALLHYLTHVAELP